MCLTVYITGASSACHYTGSDDHSPHEVRKRSHFGIEYCETLSPLKREENVTGIMKVASLA